MKERVYYKFLQLSDPPTEDKLRSHMYIHLQDHFYAEKAYGRPFEYNGQKFMFSYKNRRWHVTEFTSGLLLTRIPPPIRRFDDATKMFLKDPLFKKFCNIEEHPTALTGIRMAAGLLRKVPHIRKYQDSHRPI